MHTKEEIITILEKVFDPEIPVLTIADLGILRDVIVNDSGNVEVVITPTYSGCPAMDMISVNIKAILQEEGVENVTVKSILSPAWTTDWMTEEGKQKLKKYGIAPPLSGDADKRALMGEKRQIECPQCGSMETEMLSQFASTSCKAMFRCTDCYETFDYFKCH